MSEVMEFAPGGYRYIAGPFQYSAGVAAQPGFVIHRVRFRNIRPLAVGFSEIERHLGDLGRPVAAFCACELRSPAPFDDAGFEAFNRQYIKPLESWGIVRGNDNPIARSNVCPELDPPGEPGFYAFSYTMPADGQAPASFVIAGSAESPEGDDKYETTTIRLGERTPDAMRDKARFVLGEMERRMALLGLGWPDSSGIHVYSIYDIHNVVTGEICPRGAAKKGISWQYCRPPVDVLDYEMDVRGVPAEFVI